MDHQEKNRKLTNKEKITIAGLTGASAAIGAILGIAAYFQQWLG